MSPHLPSLPELYKATWYHGTLREDFHQAPMLHLGTSQAALEVVTNAQWQDGSRKPFTMNLHRGVLRPHALSHLLLGVDGGSQDWDTTTAPVAYINRVEDVGHWSLMVKAEDFLWQETTHIRIQPQRGVRALAFSLLGIPLWVATQETPWTAVVAAPSPSH